MEQWKKAAWSDESLVLHITWIDVRVHRLPRVNGAPVCLVGRLKVNGGRVVLWAMFCYMVTVPAIHVDVNLTLASSLNNVADQAHHRYKYVSG